jgi:KUP system potassium uptake protein
MLVWFVHHAWCAGILQIVQHPEVFKAINHCSLPIVRIHPDGFFFVLGFVFFTG